MAAFFHNRNDAGNQLAHALLSEHPHLANNPQVKVLGLARGGVPVAAQVARALHAPLDTIVVRKLGLPNHEEFAFGAIAPNGCQFIDYSIVDRAALSAQQINQIIAEQQQLLNQREAKYRAGRPPINLLGNIAVIVDDGIATGATMQAAVQFASQQGAAQIIVAVPVGPADTLNLFAPPTQVVCPNLVQDFAAVGQFYQDFESVSDEECVGLLGGVGLD